MGGTERWALTLLEGLEEFNWTISVPERSTTHPVGLALFDRWECLPVEEIPRDSIVLVSGILKSCETQSFRKIGVAHGISEYYKKMLVGCDFVKKVAVSQVGRTAFPARSNVDVIYNGVDEKRLVLHTPRERIRAKLSIPTRAIVVGYVGRWNSEKDPMAAARAASGVRGAVAMYVGPISGHEPGLLEARRLTECRFVAPESAHRIADYINAMDVCIVASHSEGFGFAIAEAWYLGVPVLATAVGIALEHPELCVRIPFDASPSRLATAIEYARSREHSRYLNVARALVLERYTARHMVERWRSLVANV